MSLSPSSNFINLSLPANVTVGITANVPVNGGANFRSAFPTIGALADQYNKLHSKTYNFVASTPQNVDLTSLVGLDGATFSLSVVRFFAYRIPATNDAYVITAGGAGTNEWNGLLTSGSKMIWYPTGATNVNDGFMIIQAPSLTGIPVGGSSKILKLDPGSNAVGEVDLIIAGS